VLCTTWATGNSTRTGKAHTTPGAYDSVDTTGRVTIGPLNPSVSAALTVVYFGVLGGGTGCRSARAGHRRRLRVTAD
jgi:hypothetical protein